MGGMLTQLGAVDNGLGRVELDYFRRGLVASLQRDCSLETVVSWHENNPPWR